MQLKLLNEIIGRVIGRQASEIVSLLAGKQNVNEFVIAKNLKLTINQTRNILYKLSDAGLVSFTRKKDRKKGWYTYFWTLDTEKSLLLLESNILLEIENLKNQLRSRENKRYYICNTCKVELNEESALLHEFTCSECGQVYELQTDKKVINELASKIKKLDESLVIIREELGKIREKAEKKKARIERKLEKKKIRKKRRERVKIKKVQKVKKVKKKKRK
jgi:transcription initiation factor TFIIE subunit alpha